MAKSIAYEFTKGLWKEVPPFRLVLGLCPVLGVTTSMKNGIGMGLATTFVLLCSNILVSLLRKVIPAKVRIACFIIIIATFVIVVEQMMAVTEQNYGLARDYFALKKKLLGLEKMKNTDIYAPLPGSDRQFSLDEAKQLVFDSFNAFSPQLANIADSFFTDQRIDCLRRSRHHLAWPTPDYPARNLPLVSDTAVV